MGANQSPDRIPNNNLPGGATVAAADLGFRALLYRFLFFDWLFADMTKARNLFERHAAWQHNRRMRRYLPTYLRRWGAIAVFAFSLGCLFEQGLAATLLAACCYTGSCVTLSGMAVIAVAWIFLSRPEYP